MSSELIKGGNCTLPRNNGTILIKHSSSTTRDINLTAFLLDDTGKVKNDDGMVFFNQPCDIDKIAQFITPIESNGVTTHQINFYLNSVSDIAKIAITLTEDNDIGFDGLNLTAEIHCDGTVTKLTSLAFNTEKGIIISEIYNRNGQTKARAVWQGFSTGLVGLCSNYGIEVDNEVKQVPKTVVTQAIKPVMKVSPSISLEKVSGKVDLSKGKKPILIEKTSEITVSISWDSNTDYDVYALVYLANGKQVDVAMFGAKGVPVLQSYKNAVRHLGDEVGTKPEKKGFFQSSIKNTICKEEIKICLDDTIKAVVPVAYSAQSNGSGSFNKYNVSMLIDNHNGTEISISAKNASKDNNIYTCVPGIITNTPNGIVIEALESYSVPNSENRPKLEMDNDRNIKVLMDRGPINNYK